MDVHQQQVTRTMNKMLVFLVFSFLPLSATKAEVDNNLTRISSDVKNPTTESTWKQTPKKQSTIADQTPTSSAMVGTVPDSVKPKALEGSTPMTPMKTKETAMSISVTPSENAPNLETKKITKHETNHAETSTVSVKVGTVPDTVKPKAEALTSMMTKETAFSISVTGSQTVPNLETKGTTNHETIYVETSTKTTKSFFTARQSQTPRIKTTTQETMTTTDHFKKTTEARIPIPTVYTTKESENKINEAVNHGKIVAGIIGGALIVMMIGFLVIYYKKQKLKKHQMATSDWAGPTPFLDGEAGNGRPSLRSANRISLNSFLPQRFSKTLSLLPETEEEMEEITSGTTFGGNQEQNEEKAVKPAKETYKNLAQTEDTVMVNETKQNGQADTGEKENRQSQSENATVQPATAEEPPKGSVNEQAGNEGSDSAV